MSEYSDFYKIIADLIDAAQRRGVDIIGYVNQMSLDLASSEMSEDEIEVQRLDNQIDATYEMLNLRHSEYTTEMLKFVFNLQKYTDDNYGSVNDFLRDEETKVKTIFADISGTVGYKIDSDNIEGGVS